MASSFLLTIFGLMLVISPLVRGSVHLWAETLLLGVGGMVALGHIWIRQHRGASLCQPTAVAPGVLFLTVWVWISALCSPHWILSLEGGFFFLGYLVLWGATVATCATASGYRLLPWILVGSGLLVAGIGLLKGLGWPIWVHADLEPVPGWTGPFGNHNHFAGYLEMTLPMALCLALDRHHSRQIRGLMAAVGMFMLLALGMSLSRGGWMGGVAGLGILFLGKNLHRRSLGLAGVLVVVGVLLWGSPAFMARLEEFIGTDPGVQGGFRLQNWASVGRMILASPWTGTGPGTFAQAFVSYPTPGMGVLPRYAHNDLLHFMAELGLIFLVPAVWILWGIFRQGVQSLKGRKCRRGISLGALAGLVSILVHSLVDFNFQIPSNALVAMVLAGLILASGLQREPAHWTRPQIVGAVHWVKGGVFGLICLWLVSGLGTLTLSRHAYQQARTLLVQTDFTGALHHLDRARCLVDRVGLPTWIQRDEFRILSTRGRAAHELGKSLGPGPEQMRIWYRSLAAYGRALEMDGNHYQTRLGRAQLLSDMVRAGYGGDARSDFEHALVLRPTGAYVHYTFLDYLALLKDETAMAEWACGLARISPAWVAHLRRARFYTPQLAPWVHRGLQLAVAEDIQPRVALFQLSDMAVGQGNLPAATRYLSRALDLNPAGNSAGDYLRLGELYLQGRDLSSSTAAFLQSLSGAGASFALLDQIFLCHVTWEQVTGFFQFMDLLDTRYHAPAWGAYFRARAHVILAEYDQARELILQMLDSGAGAPDRAHALLGRVAELQGDWAAMESAMSRAVKLAPQNSEHWQKLSMALAAQKKYIQAEAASDQAVERVPQPRAWYLLHRAGLRGKNANYGGALADLKAARALSPNEAVIYHALAQTHGASGNLAAALAAIGHARHLAPNNPTYLRFQAKLMASVSGLSPHPSP